MARMCMWYIYTSRVEPNKRFYALATVTQRGCTLNSLVGLSQIKAFMPWLHRELSPKRCDRLNIFKTITVQKNPIVLTGCKRCSDLTFLSSQISTFGMVIVCTGTDHRRRSVEIYVGLSFQCSVFLEHRFRGEERGCIFCVFLRVRVGRNMRLYFGYFAHCRKVHVRKVPKKNFVELAAPNQICGTKIRSSLLYRYRADFKKRPTRQCISFATPHQSPSERARKPRAKKNPRSVLHWTSKN